MCLYPLRKLKKSEALLSNIWTIHCAIILITSLQNENTLFISSSVICYLCNICYTLTARWHCSLINKLVPDGCAKPLLAVLFCNISLCYRHCSIRSFWSFISLTGWGYVSYFLRGLIPGIISQSPSICFKTNTTIHNTNFLENLTFLSLVFQCVDASTANQSYRVWHNWCKCSLLKHSSIPLQSATRCMLNSQLK